MNARARSDRVTRRPRGFGARLLEVQGRLARNVRWLRVNAGISQEMLAVDAQLQTAHVSKIELGLANPTLKVLTRLARALEVDVADLWARDGVSERGQLQNLRRGRKPRPVREKK